jgi:hypothetical protein
MKKMILVLGLTASLLFAVACSKTGTANKNTSTTQNPSNSPVRTTNGADPSTSNTTNTASTNASSSTAPSEEGKQDFTLVNSTGVEINSLYISPHDTNDWEEDILGRDTLPSGETVNIKFHRSEKAAMWDLRVEDKQGNSIEWENLNLLEISKVTLHYENGKATAETE